jgi:CubicO group peptidase (beta-lactamase class C family)
MMALIEAPQRPNRKGLDPLSLTGMMTRYGVPGVSLAVIQDFAVQWAKGHGIADVETGAPVTAETLFQAAFIRKPVAAMAVLRAVQEGRLSLDEEVNRFLRSWRVPPSEFNRQRPVTLRTLLSHTSGTGDGFGFPGYLPDAPVPTPPQILNGEKPSNVGPVLLERPPLTAAKYSGGAYTVAQVTLSDVLGKPFPAILQEYVLTPIGMTRSAYDQPRIRVALAGQADAPLSDSKLSVCPFSDPRKVWTPL